MCVCASVIVLSLAFAGFVSTTGVIQNASTLRQFDTSRLKDGAVYGHSDFYVYETCGLSHEATQQ